MANTAFGAQERAAKALKKAPAGVGLDVEGLGTLDFDIELGKRGQVQGITPELSLSPEAARLQGLFGDVAGAAGTEAARLAPGVGAAAGEFTEAGRGLLADVSGFDPMQAAGTRFERLQSVLEPQRARQRASQEARLLAQGRLDSSGGGLQIGETEQAIAREDAMLLDRLFGEAETARSRGIADARSLAGAGAQMQGGLFGELQQGAAGRRAEFDPLFRMLGASEAIKAGEVNRQVASANALGGFNAAAGAASGGGGTGELLGTLAGAGLGFATAGPGGGLAGAQAGATLGGGVGGLFDSL